MDETGKRKFDEVDVANALVNIPEYRKNLLCGFLKMDELMEFANEKEKFLSYSTKVMTYVNVYLEYARALEEFSHNLTTCNTVDSWIDQVTQRYKELEVSDKEKLYKNLFYSLENIMNNGAMLQ